MDRQEKGPGPNISRPPARFEFVTEHDSQTQVRQHVAKLNWRRRKEQKKAPSKSGPSRPRQIAAFPMRPHHAQPQSSQKIEHGDLEEVRHENTEPSNSGIEFQPASTGQLESDAVCMDLRHTLILMSPTRKFKLLTTPAPDRDSTEIVLSPYHPLNSMDLDPFNTIKPLSRIDQRLLHHCKLHPSPMPCSQLLSLISQGSMNMPIKPLAVPQTLRSTRWEMCMFQ